MIVVIREREREKVQPPTSGEICQYIGKATILSKFNFSPVIVATFPSAPIISPDLSSFQSRVLLGLVGSEGASAVPLLGGGHCGFGFVVEFGS